MVSRYTVIGLMLALIAQGCSDPVLIKKNESRLWTQDTTSIVEAVLNEMSVNSEFFKSGDRKMVIIRNQFCKDVKALHLEIRSFDFLCDSAKTLNNNKSVNFFIFKSFLQINDIC